MDVLNRLVNREIVTVEYNASLQQAAQIMRDKRIGSLLVVKDGEYVGIFSETDVTRRAAAEGLDPKKVTIESIMTTPIISLEIKTEPEKANDLMKDKGIRHLPLTENGKIIGIISVRDLLRFFKVYYNGIGSLKEK
ncbi:MAG TPA: CBS domain-containing protein [Nitrospiria bacterium]